MEQHVLGYDIKGTIVAGTRSSDDWYVVVDECGATSEFKPNEDSECFADWTMALSNSKRNAGNCNYEKKQVEISRYFLERASVAELENVIRHELAHVVTGPYVDEPHGEEWKHNCRILDCDAERLTRPFTRRKDFKYLVYCGSGCRMSRDTLRPGIEQRRCLAHGNYLRVKNNI